MTKLSYLTALCLMLSCLTPQEASATTFNLMIGDNDGYGEGVADNAPVVTMANCCVDQRDPLEQIATDGAQETDINSALFSTGSTTASFRFFISGVVTSATLTLDIGGIQTSTWGETLASFNGVLQTGLLAIEQGVTGTAVLSFVLDSTALANLNSDGFFDLTLDRNNNSDAIFIDYVSLSGTIAPIPVPASLPLLLAALGGLALLRRRRAVA